MKHKNAWYWACQLIGWGGWTAINLFFVYLFASNYFVSGQRYKYFIASLLIQFVWYVFATHLLRLFLKKIEWIRLPLRQVLPLFLFSVIITGLITYYGAKTTAVTSKLSLAQYEKREDLKTAMQREEEKGFTGTKYYLAKPNVPADSAAYQFKTKLKGSTGWYRNSSGVWKYEDPRKGRFWWDIIFNFILISLWLLIYMIWHYFLRNQKDQFDKLTLEKTVKDLELRTIKSHINPHFIFNSLNSIRALVEENPARARRAVTELSNLLRSSLQMGKRETVLLEEEMKIVKDYLALEHIRFEERLRIQLDLADNTLKERVPPMMLQTLVENAIKHGISQHNLGGVVAIQSKIDGNDLVLIVRNTGVLNKREPGFGLKSTRERLHLLYGGRAGFRVEQIKEDTVEARVSIPIT